MSVDRDIKEGLVMLDQRLPTPDTYTAYEQIVHEGRTRTRRARVVQTALLAAAVVAIVASGQIGVPGTDPGPAAAPVDRPDASVAASADSASGSDSASGLDGWEDIAGTWTARDVSIASMAAHLESLGIGGAADELRRTLPRPFVDGVDLSLEFRLGYATLRYDGREMDRQSYAVEDGILYLRPQFAPGGRSRFSAEIEGEQLRLEFVDTTVPSHGDVSEEVILTALNTSAPFEREVP